MGNVLTFTSHSKLAALEPRELLTGAALRASLEAAAQTPLDAADSIIAVLDRMAGDVDHEEGGDAEPSRAAPENLEGSQVGYMRGNDQDSEAEAPDIALPDAPADPAPELNVIQAPRCAGALGGTSWRSPARRSSI
jgi:hypothetical protein